MLYVINQLFVLVYVTDFIFTQKWKVRQLRQVDVILLI